MARATALEAGVAPGTLPTVMARDVVDQADAFSNVFVVATILVACCLVPAYLLPGRNAQQHVDQAMLVGH